MWETISEIGRADENLVCAQEEFRLPSRSYDHAIAILENRMKAYAEATGKHMRVARAQAQMSQTQVAPKRLINEHEAGKLERHDVCRMW